MKKYEWRATFIMDDGSKIAMRIQAGGLNQAAYKTVVWEEKNGARCIDLHLVGGALNFRKERSD